MVDEGLAQALLAAPAAEGNLALGPLQQARHGLVEPEDVEGHADEGRPQQIPALGEQPVHRRAFPFQTRGFVLDTERHGGGPQGRPQVPTEREEIRVGAVIADDEARIHRQGPAPLGHGVGVDVAAPAVVGLEHRHVMTSALAEPRRGQTGDA